MGHLDLQRRQVYALPDHVKRSIEVKIQQMHRWTCLEKAHVYSCKHEETISYILAYALSQATVTRRNAAVWLSLGMDTGAAGHANAVCLHTDGKVAKAWVYDPNYAPGQDH